MTSDPAERIGSNRRQIVSALWVYVLLNILFRDMHELLRQGAYEGWQAQQVTDAVLVASGIALTGFISMIVLTLVLPARGARIGNLVVPVIAFLGMVTADIHDPDDVWFLVAEVVGLVGIGWLAWTWPTAAEVMPEPAGHVTGRG